MHPLQRLVELSDKLAAMAEKAAADRTHPMDPSSPMYQQFQVLLRQYNQDLDKANAQVMADFQVAMGQARAAAAAAEKQVPEAAGKVKEAGPKPSAPLKPGEAVIAFEQAHAPAWATVDSWIKALQNLAQAPPTPSEPGK